MRRYETIFILRPNASEDKINQIIDSMTEIITNQNGSVIELNKWGMKKLAYLIKKESMGYYIFCDYATTPAAVAEIERKSRIDDAVLKYMTVKLAAAIDDEEIAAAREAASTKASTEKAEAQETADEAQTEADAD